MTLVVTWHIEDEEWVWVVLGALRELLRNSIGGFTFSSFIAYSDHMIVIYLLSQHNCDILITILPIVM